jgi:hypothetical protein
MAQALLAHELQRRHGHRGGHERVAVAVATDPRAEHEQRRDRLSSRLGVLLDDRRLQIAIDPRHGVGKRGGEVDEPGPDLIRDGALGRSQVV